MLAGFYCASEGTGLDIAIVCPADSFARYGNGKRYEQTTIFMVLL